MVGVGNPMFRESRGSGSVESLAHPLHGGPNSTRTYWDFLYMWLYLRPRQRVVKVCSWSQELTIQALKEDTPQLEGCNSGRLRMPWTLGWILVYYWGSIKEIIPLLGSWWQMSRLAPSIATVANSTLSIFICFSKKGYNNNLPAHITRLL